MAIRVAIVDDHAIVRAGLRMVLESDPDLEVVGEADTAAGAIRLVCDTVPDVALVDINLPDESGLRVVEEIRKNQPGVRLIVLSVHDDREIVRESVRIGANGYVRKDTTPADLRAAIRAVYSGDAFFSPTVARSLAEALREQPATGAVTLEGLTVREREVLAGIARGLQNKEIAAELKLSLRTIEGHISRILDKKNLSNRVELALDVRERRHD